MLQPFAFVAFSDGKPDSTFPENALGDADGAATPGCTVQRKRGLLDNDRPDTRGPRATGDHRLAMPDLVVQMSPRRLTRVDQPIGEKNQSVQSISSDLSGWLCRNCDHRLRNRWKPTHAQKMDLVKAGFLQQYIQGAN
jgi:hypothetical protein